MERIFQISAAELGNHLVQLDSSAPHQVRVQMFFVGGDSDSIQADQSTASAAKQIAEKADKDMPIRTAAATDGSADEEAEETPLAATPRPARPPAAATGGRRSNASAEDESRMKDEPGEAALAKQQAGERVSGRPAERDRRRGGQTADAKKEAGLLPHMPATQPAVTPPLDYHDWELSSELMARMFGLLIGEQHESNRSAAEQLGSPTTLPAANVITFRVWLLPPPTTTSAPADSAASPPTTRPNATP